MVNNIAKVRDLLRFDTPGMFYFIQVIKRRKDNPGLPRDMKRVAEYFVYSLKYFDEHLQQIVEEANINNARVYIHLNRRDSKKTALKAMMIIGDYLNSGQTDAAKTAYTSACGKQHSDRDKKWVVDVDEKHMDRLEDIKGYVQQGNIIAELPTKTGVHLITKPFRRDAFYKEFPGVDVHNDSPHGDVHTRWEWEVVFE